MTERITWPSHHFEPESPFTNSVDRRPLRITLHSQTLSNMSAQDQEALVVLRELSKLPDIEILQTEPGEFLHIQLDLSPYPDRNAEYPGYAPILIDYGDGGGRSAGVLYPKQYWVIAAGTLEVAETDESVVGFYTELMMARASFELSQDIFVTTSSQLLKHRSGNYWIRGANPRTPSETIKILGLLLRSRHCYVVYVGSNTTANTDKEYFYRILAQHLLPGFQRYSKACLQLSVQNKDDSVGLSYSALERVVRVLDARDQLGMLFYIPFDQSSRQSVAYHFDYVSLLLAGAIDAQARVVWRIFMPTSQKISEYTASFQNQYDTNKHPTKQSRFVKELKSLPLATALVALVTHKKTKVALILLHALRNTIHAVNVPMRSVRQSNEPDAYLIHLIKQDIYTLYDTVIEAVSELGGLEKWGVKHEQLNIMRDSNTPPIVQEQLSIEPYKFAMTLIETITNIINQIADATDFMDVLGVNPLPTDGKPNIPGIMDEIIDKRITILG